MQVTTIFMMPLVIQLLIFCSDTTHAQQIHHKQHDDPEHHYPKEVHRMVMERLQHSRGRGRGGSWGEWSSWTQCSRTCGSGVSIQSRECLNNYRQGRRRSRRRSIAYSRNGSRCVGLYKRFQLCNKQACGPGFTDFRREQCASFNKTPFNRRFYTWEPYYDTPDSCALNCRAAGLSFYATLNQTVIDGTPCGQPNSNQLCVAGRCMAVGCDGVLGSGLQLDSCGICGGDNSSCRPISGIFSRVTMPYGYNAIATLPAGANNITIHHTSPSANFLALRQQGGEFFLNGNWAANVSGYYQSVGTTFIYQRPDPFQGDKVMAAGPLHFPVDVLLFFQSTNPGIKYEYRLPMTPSGKQRLMSATSAPQHTITPADNNPLNPRVPGRPASTNTHTGPVNDARSFNGHENSSFPSWRRKERIEAKKKRRKDRKGKKGEGGTRNGRRGHRKRFEWKVVGFTTCSETCGGGTQTTRVVCVKKRRGSEAPSTFCHHLPKPVQETVRCNLRPCPPQWQPEEWGDCSVTCGLGVQVRTLACKVRLSPDNFVTQPEGSCLSVPDITKAQVCELPECDAAPSWETGEWGACSSQCGLGTRHRSVTCVAAQGTVSDSLCDPTNKPSNQELCDMGSCATDTWFFSAWDEGCSDQCGEGVQRRRVHCSGDALDNQITESSCNSEQPPTTRICHSERECGGKWFAGPWGECSAECGKGQQSRPIVCIIYKGRWRVTGDSSQCKGQSKPQSTQQCTKICGNQWYTSEWSQCSVSCGSGVQRREVKCLDEDQVPALGCTSATKPDTRQTCNTQSCSIPEEQADQSVNVVPNPIRESQTPSDSPTVDRKPSGSCMDRMKNCHLVYKARLCRLKYYSKLCCKTCTVKP